MAFAIGLFTFATLALAEDAQSEIEKAKAMREQIAKNAQARKEGFTSRNNKYGVNAGQLLEEAEAFSINHNPRHQELAKVLEDTRKLEEATAKAKADLEEMDSNPGKPEDKTVAIGATTDAPSLAQRCRAINAKNRDRSVAQTKVAIDQRQIVNSAKFSVEPDSTGGSRIPASADNGGASRMKRGR